MNNLKQFNIQQKYMKTQESKWILQGGKDMYPLIEGLSLEETKKNLEMAGATSEEADKLLELGDKAKDAIIKITMREWEGNPTWASQIMHAVLVELGIRKENEEEK